MQHPTQLTAFVAAGLSALILAACGGGNTERNVTEVVVFGDSLSDVGTYNPTTLDLDASNDRPDGLKFTVNPGAVWTEVVAGAYGISLRPNKQVNFGSPVAISSPVTVPANGKIITIGGSVYAQGGARLSVDGANGGLVPANASIPWPTQQATALSITTQVSTYLGTRTKFTDNQLVLMQGGANDFFAFLGGVAAGQIAPTPANVGATVTTVATAMVTQVKTVVASGATKVMYANLPDLGSTPQFAGTPLQALATQMTDAYNAAVASALSGTPVVVFDLNTVFKDVMANPSSFGLTNVTGTACKADATGAVQSLTCSAATVVAAGAQNAYLFADKVHPTPAGHKLWGDRAAALALSKFPL